MPARNFLAAGNPAVLRLALLALTTWLSCAALLYSNLPAAALGWLSILLLLSGISFGTAAVLTWRHCCAAACAKQPTRTHNKRRAASRLTVAALMIICAGLCSAKIGVSLAARETLPALATTGTAHTVTVAGYPKYAATTASVLATLHSPAPATVKITLSPETVAMLPATALAPGAQLTVTGKLHHQPTHNFAAANLFAKRVTPVSDAPLLFALAAQWRRSLVNYAAATPWLNLVPGFTYGDTQLMSAQLTAEFRATGLLHLTAVSGGNCALVIAACTHILGVFGCGRTSRLLMALAALLSFALLVGPDPSLQRAAAMAVITLSSKFGAQRSVGLVHLSWAVIGLLSWQPWQAIQLGFVLSVVATGAIICCASTLQRYLGGSRFKWFSLPLSVTLAAQLAVAPFLRLITPEISLAAIPANLLAAPLAPLLTGGGLLLMLLLQLLPQAAPLASLPLQGSSWLLTAIAHHGSNLLGATVPWVPGIPGALLLAALEMSIVALLLWRRQKQRAAWHNTLLTGYSRQQPAATRAMPETFANRSAAAKSWQKRFWLRRRFTILIALCAALALLTQTPKLLPGKPPTDWAIIACDVGQGDSLLLRNPAHPATVILVDTGDSPAKLQRCLTKFGVTQLAAIVLTHDDKDHIGAAELAATYTSHAIIAPQPGGSKRKLLPKLAHEAVAQVTAGQIITVDVNGNPAIGSSSVPGVVFDSAFNGSSNSAAKAAPENEFKVPAGVVPAGAVPAIAAIAPAAPVPGAADPPLKCIVLWPVSTTVTGTNEASLVLHCDLGELTALLLADTGAAQHRSLLQLPPELLRADIVKAAHHGSRDQDGRLLQQAAAKYVIFSAGKANSYGHPTVSALQASTRAGSINLRTDIQGSIAITPSSVWSEHHSTH